MKYNTNEKLAYDADWRKNGKLKIICKENVKMEKNDLITILKSQKEEELKFLKDLDFENDLESPKEIRGNQKEIEDEIKKFNKHEWAIYLFFVGKNFKFDLAEYSRAKGNYQMARCPEEKDLKERKDEVKDGCLYVGSSQNLISRLEQHLTAKSKTVYALHLSEWFPQDEELRLIVIKMKNQDAEKMQKYEDYLWNHYKPLLGKQGKK